MFDIEDTGWGVGVIQRMGNGRDRAVGLECLAADELEVEFENVRNRLDSRERRQFEEELSDHRSMASAILAEAANRNPFAPFPKPD
jgi:hypothetical protein